VRAVVYDAIGQTPTVRTIPDPECPRDGVVVEVAATGICRSDWHAWRGHDPVPLPHVPGHEFAGTVVASGAGVRTVAVGDRVTVPFVCGCGRCPVCEAGDPQACPHQTQPGFTGNGSFAELVALHAADANVVHLPDSLDLMIAASLGCRFATAFRAVTVHGRVVEGDWVAVHGCGGLGLSAVMIAAALGARVIAIDISADALRMASTFGAEITLDGAAPGVATAVRECTAGGAQVSIDAVGSPGVAAESVRCLRPRGRHVQAGLLLGGNAAVPLPMDLVISGELAIHGSHGMAAHEYPRMLAMIGSGLLRPAELVRRTISLDEAPGALCAMDNASSGPGITLVDLRSHDLSTR
jgi:D-arabinose 1-dehydrogenase-like Zn-dependent alcohol dehydrogenase